MSVSERWCRHRSFGCSLSSRRFGCNADVLASIMVGFLSSYSGYRGANGISDRNAKNERKNELDRFHFVSPLTEPIFFNGTASGRPIKFLSDQIHRLRNVARMGAPPALRCFHTHVPVLADKTNGTEPRAECCIAGTSKGAVLCEITEPTSLASTAIVLFGPRIF